MREKIIRKVGLARVLSKRGYCSRTRAAELIRSGRVSVNGRIRRDPEAPTASGDRIAVDGNPIRSQEKIYLMLNKPRGIVSTASDEKARKTIYDLESVATWHDQAKTGTARWIAPVGRLDKASEGLLLLTNDSKWGARIAAPETHLVKIYHVQITGIADEECLRRLVHGVTAEDGALLRAKQASLLRAGAKNCWLEVVLEEGKNRQIRRMVEALGAEVLRLVRVAIGPLKLGDLAKGSCRALTREEKRTLDRAMERKS